MSTSMGKPAAAGRALGTEEPPDTGVATPVAVTGERHKLTALQALAALSLDAMASVAYGPESIVLVLAAAGAYGNSTPLPRIGRQPKHCGGTGSCGSPAWS
ncbi:hypothetical protein ABZZ20_34820 [Streptomyces sp. NPDC006430]|uniref:hypothetical protein n=1 Tax=Streptomyces sp. NPDC006430 TaxID=3154299 RepID=UPI0033B13EF4